MLCWLSAEKIITNILNYWCWLLFIIIFHWLWMVCRNQASPVQPHPLKWLNINGDALDELNELFIYATLLWIFSSIITMHAYFVIIFSSLHFFFISFKGKWWDECFYIILILKHSKHIFIKAPLPLPLFTNFNLFSSVKW